MDETVESRPALRFVSAAQLQSAAQVIQSDVEYILENAQACFSLLAGKDVLLVGGAGFLGYYFVKSIVAWNNSQASDSQIRLHVFDNYIRAFRLGSKNLKRHGQTLLFASTTLRMSCQAAVQTMITSSCSIDRLSYFLSQASDRNYGCQREWPPDSAQPFCSHTQESSKFWLFVLFDKRNLWGSYAREHPNPGIISRECFLHWA